MDLGKRAVVLMLAMALFRMIDAAVYKVGDSAGWTTIGNVDYKQWAATKTFQVGDTIVFKYSQFHNVMRVTHAMYKACNASAPLATYTTGNDSITLKTRGHHFFFCGVPGHCQAGQKVDINVPRNEEDMAPTPASSSSPPSTLSPPVPDVKSRKDDIAIKTKITICEEREDTEFECGDVLIFPDMIKYKCLKDSDVDGFVDDVLVNGKQWTSAVQKLNGAYVFVCAHGSRDKRCGVCGPVLIEKLKEEIESRGLRDQVFVAACSHVGGHKYAGNLIVYSPDSEGKIMGHWYGYVTPDDVPEIFDQHIGQGIVIERIWRGQMGAPTEEGKMAAEQMLPNGKAAKERKKREESNSEITQENVGGCCQGSNGFSCCRDGSLGVNEERKLEKNINAHGKKGLGKASSWIASLEQSDVLAAVAVIGAVATVAVAYSLYKKSG